MKSTYKALISLLVFAVLAAGAVTWFLEAPSVSRSARVASFAALERCIGKVPAKGTLLVIDFSQPSQRRRLAMLNMSSRKPAFHARVAHGRNSGGSYAIGLSDELGSLKSCGGLFSVGGIFTGAHGPSLRLSGLEPNLNGNAEKRGIIIHAGEYVSIKSIVANWKEGFRLGRSEGCFVLSSSQFRRLLEEIEQLAYLYAYNENTSKL
jgi:hypothetical protein